MLVQPVRTDAECKHFVSCSKKVAGETNNRHDIFVNILMNNILIERGSITQEQRWEDMKMVRTDTMRSPLGQIIGAPKNGRVKEESYDEI